MFIVRCISAFIGCAVGCLADADLQERDRNERVLVFADSEERK